MVNSRNKGKRGELEAVHAINAIFGTGFIRSQQHKGALKASDIIDADRPGLHPEVKRRQSFDLHAAVEKSRDETGDESTPFVMHRKNGQRWLVTADLADCPALVCELAAALVESGQIDWLGDADSENLKVLATLLRKSRK